MNDTSSPETELILIRITGIDRLGLTAAVSNILARYHVDV